MPDVDPLLAAYDAQMRPAETANLPPGVYAEPDGPIVRVVGQHRGLISAPPDLHLDAAALDALIGRQRDFFAARSEAVEWKTRAHDRPASIGQRLAAAGFTAEEPGTLAIGLAQDTPRHDLRMPAGIVVRQTTDEADMHQIAAMESEVWNEDWSWLADDLIVWLRGAPDQIAVLVAEAAGKVVAAAWLVCKPGTEFAGLWGGSTLAGWRRRGIYRALVARRAQLAMARGVRYLHVDASGNSRPVLERLGFVAVTTTTNYVWAPGWAGPSS